MLCTLRFAWLVGMLGVRGVMWGGRCMCLGGGAWGGTCL